MFPSRPRLRAALCQGPEPLRGLARAEKEKRYGSLVERPILIKHLMRKSA